MSKPFRCGGPIGSDGPVNPSKTARMLFTPQTRFRAQCLRVPDGFKVVSVRRIPYAEIEFGGVFHGMACKPLTVRPRPAVKMKHRFDDRRRLHLLGKTATVCLSEALELVVHNTTREPLLFQAYVVGTTERAEH